MENEYVIISKTAIEKRIDELENTKYPNLRVDLEVLKEILVQSTPLIPENIKPLQELVDEGYDPYDSAHHLQVQRMLKVIQDYITNLKLDI